MSSDVKWKVPRWHPDHGDAAKEVALLRLFYDGILGLCPDLSGRLVDHEPGYLSLILDREGEELAEVLVARDRVSRYGVFLRHGEDEEHYVQDPEEAAPLFFEVWPVKARSWALVKSRLKPALTG